MSVVRCRLAIIFCLTRHVLTFSANDQTAFYVKNVERRMRSPGPKSVTCTCPTVEAAICKCVHEGVTYEIEAPFASLLLEEQVSRPVQWPPLTQYQINKDLNNLTGIEEPLNYLKRMPRSLSKIATTFTVSYMELNKKLSTFKMDYTTLKSWNSKIKNKPSKLYVLVHGWTGSPADLEYQSLKSGLLHRLSEFPIALIDVNWNRRNPTLYSQAVADTAVIGRQLAYLIFVLVRGGKCDPENVHLLGIDMGSHIASIAAVTFSTLAENYNTVSPKSRIGTRLGRRTGFNPLARHFYRVLEDNYLTDAKFVDIYHTTIASSAARGGSDDDILKRKIGISTLGDDYSYNLNRLHFYPNGGSPGSECEDRRFGCELNLATGYFAASLRTYYNRSAFTSYQCDSYKNLNRCSRYTDTATSTGVMGIDADSTSSRGNHFLRFSIPKEALLKDDFEPSFTCQVRGGPHLPIVTPQVRYQSQFGDWPGCGKFKPQTSRKKRNSGEERLFKGTVPVKGHLPSTVCIIGMDIWYRDIDFDKTTGKLDVTRNKLRNEDDYKDPLPLVYDQKTTNRFYAPWGWTTKCTGSLISDRWVVTAAHCFKSFKNGIPMYFVFGSDDCFAPPAPNKDMFNYFRRVIIEKKEISTQTIFYHDEYEFPEYPSEISVPDIALVRIEPLPASVLAGELVTPICFESAKQFLYRDCDPITAAGFGLKGEIYNGKLTWIKGHIYDAVDPKYKFGAHSRLFLQESRLVDAWPDEIFSFANMEEHHKTNVKYGRAVCGGDSGGPVMDFSDKRATLVGVMQSGTSPCAKAKHRIDAATFAVGQYFGPRPEGLIWIIPPADGMKVGIYVDWIKRVMKEGHNNNKPYDHFANASNPMTILDFPRRRNIVAVTPPSPPASEDIPPFG